MRVIITLDKKNGYSFFSKRISSDVEVSKDILKSLPDGEKLYMSSYSKSLFPDEYAIGKIEGSDRKIEHFQGGMYAAYFV